MFIYVCRCMTMWIFLSLNNLNWGRDMLIPYPYTVSLCDSNTCKAACILMDAYACVEIFAVQLLLIN